MKFPFDVCSNNCFSSKFKCSRWFTWICERLSKHLLTFHVFKQILSCLIEDLHTTVEARVGRSLFCSGELMNMILWSCLATLENLLLFESEEDRLWECQVQIIRIPNLIDVRIIFNPFQAFFITLNHPFRPQVCLSTCLFCFYTQNTS
jgi:hypothetical protein